MGCEICPRNCAVDREREVGYCGAAAFARIARAALHFYEEPAISGTHGSGTVFFSGCNMRCIFCQNMEISARQKGELCTPQRMADLFLSLEKQGAHNINLVTPTPHLPAIRWAILLARETGLSIPIVYNTNGYERVEALRAMRSLVDIYLPDLKFVSPAFSARYAGTPNYFAYAAPALLEMYKQVGPLQTDAEGIAIRGILIRHLILPGCLEDTRGVLDFLHTALPKDTPIALLRQYTPVHAELPAPLNRKLTAREYDRAVEYALSLGFSNLLLQEEASASETYIPAFFTDLTSCNNPIE